MDYEYENLLNSGCHYCGKNVLQETGSCLDRIDSNKDYYLYNVVACCKRCNIAKNDMSFLEFIIWIEKVYNHTQSIINMVQNSNKQYSYKEEKDLHKKINTGKKTFIGV